MIKDIIQAILSLIIIAAFMDMSYMALFTDKSVHDSATFELVYGSVSVMAGSVLNFWFGSSRSSTDKDKIISTLTTGATQ